MRDFYDMLWVTAILVILLVMSAHSVFSKRAEELPQSTQAYIKRGLP